MKKLAIALIAVFGISGVAFAEPTLDRSFNNVTERASHTPSAQVQVPAEGIYSFNA
jgi:hypothetical protein